MGQVTIGYLPRTLFDMNRQEIFDLYELKLGYSNETTVLILDTLKIPATALTYIVGKSGVGKTTLLELLACINDTLLNPGQGKVIFNPSTGPFIDFSTAWHSKDFSLNEIRKKFFSFIFQKNNLFEDLSVWENLLIIGSLRGSSANMLKQEALLLFQKFGLDVALFDRKIAQLSEGQRQRVAFIRGLTQNYEVLFADEPTGNLDPGFARVLMHHLRDEVIQQNKSAIIVSHDISLAAEFGDCIILLGSDKSDPKSGRLSGLFHLTEAGKWVNEKQQLLSSAELIYFINQSLIDEN